MQKREKGKKFKKFFKSLLKVEKIVIYLVILVILLTIGTAGFFLYGLERIRYIPILGKPWEWGIVFLSYIASYTLLTRTKKAIIKSITIGTLSLVVTISFWIDVTGYLTRFIIWHTNTTFSGIFLSLVLNLVLVSTMKDQSKFNKFIVLAIFLTLGFGLGLIIWVFTKDISNTISYGTIPLLASLLTQLLIFKLPFSPFVPSIFRGIS